MIAGAVLVVAAQWKIEEILDNYVRFPIRYGADVY